MYYIAYIGMAIVIIHFILYYFNIDVFNYPIKPESKPIYNDITDSINELKKLNEYIDNETGISEKGTCEKGPFDSSVIETSIRDNGPEDTICKTI
jgi:hypothetical protein